MKFATIKRQSNDVIVLLDATAETYYPLGEVLKGMPAGAMSDFAAAIPLLMEAEPIANLPPGRPLDFGDLVAPILNPPHNIMCVGKNYRAHANEFAKSGFDSSSTSSADAVPEFPIIFTKPSTTISGPASDIPLVPGLDQAVDYECELAVVIGKGGRAIPRDEAMAHVFGYTIVNDVTARDLQQRHKQWFLGKSPDGFCPMGPWIITADEVDYRDMRVICRVNGEVRQNASTRDLIFDIPVLIETISKVMTLSPGDIIATGTPEGVGIGFTPPRFLRDGDVVECEISGIGKIRNTVKRAGCYRRAS
ncbi:MULTISPECIES: fumarylacetoacetate hydrolase family protein [unclassified Hyphomicrobium]|uniref:fumarylacetoacetate hydrolase family protein n=1 Tax=unclassified Hyphomicrobium TaxID=2619925 RepID=UPI000213F84F|nr:MULTISPECIES: fumarylacetoacetate hydrolase family protein [unclassified Hyphomicrobium]CCB63426.1 Fumarylacetoacetate (FAA) hydrolase [Hyphomicrobium sp. MC1]